jgi:hypothetical protein
MREKESSSPELFDESYRTFFWAVDAGDPNLKMLQAMDRLLDEVPEILEMVDGDLRKAAPGKTAKKGRAGPPTRPPNRFCAARFSCRCTNGRTATWPVT